MSYSNAYIVRTQTPLITKSVLTDDQLLEAIYDSDSKIDSYIKSRYITPIEKITNLTGTISVIENSDTILGVNTLFSTEVKQGMVLQVKSTGEVLRIKKIDSNTVITCSSEAKNTYSGSEFLDIPSDIATVSKFLSTQLLMMIHFSEQAYNQETMVFNKQFEYFARPILDRLEKGSFNYSLLKSTPYSDNDGRLVYSLEDDLYDERTAFEAQILQSYM